MVEEETDIRENKREIYHYKDKMNVCKNKMHVYPVRIVEFGSLD